MALKYKREAEESKKRKSGYKYDLDNEENDNDYEMSAINTNPDASAFVNQTPIIERSKTEQTPERVNVPPPIPSHKPQKLQEIQDKYGNIQQQQQQSNKNVIPQVGTIVRRQDVSSRNRGDLT